MHNLDLSIADISKVEGKASCNIKIREGKVEEVKFIIAEYKRFYTQAIRGKDIMALPQLTARICGTCSNAHLLCALKAVENAVNLVVSEQTIALRKLLNYGLIIRDHALHLCVFVLPDIFHKDSILDFDEKNPDEHKWLDATFSIKAAGNQISKIVGGRSVHAPFLTPGGFIKLPNIDDLRKCVQELTKVREAVLDLIELFVKKDGDLKVDGLNFAAISDSEYSFLYGELIRNAKFEESTNYGQYLERRIIDNSQASGYLLDGKVTMVGALARLNLAKDKLNFRTKKDTVKYLKIFPSNNIFHNNLAQAIEILHAIDSSIEIINNLKITDEKPVSVKRDEGIGIGVIEAPRGILYYRLEVDKTGKIKNGQIVVPTGVNQLTIEKSIIRYLNDNIQKIKDKETVEMEVEKIVRAFDPCMSCASHFLKFKWS